jgi:hypothetical protein
MHLFSVVLPLMLSLGARAGEPTAPGAAAHQPARPDVDALLQSVERVQEQVLALTPGDRAQAVDSLRFLYVNCPYTRAALQLPFALQELASAVDPDGLDPAARADWGQLQAGLAVHVAVLESLGIDGAGQSPMIAGIPGLAAEIDAETLDLIELHSARVEQLTGIARPCPRGPWSVLPGQPWTLGAQLTGWTDLLVSLEPLAVEATAQQGIADMAALLQAYGHATHASVDP